MIFQDKVENKSIYQENNEDNPETAAPPRPPLPPEVKHLEVKEAEMIPPRPFPPVAPLPPQRCNSLGRIRSSNSTPVQQRKIVCRNGNENNEVHVLHRMFTSSKSNIQSSKNFVILGLITIKLVIMMIEIRFWNRD